MAINVKWGVYAAVAALFLAFLTSIFLGHASFAAALLRALCFAALFFALGTGAWALINNFMPELLFPESSDATANIFGTESEGSQSSDYGSHINITLGDGEDIALPDEADPNNVGNIADLVSGAVDPAAEAKKEKGLDEFNENSYTDSAGDAASSLNDFGEPASAGGGSGGGFEMNFDSFAMGGGTTGLETFGDSFSLPADSGATAKEEEFLPERKVTGNKPVALEGDFNPKDIAAGIRTVLENDKKG
jgi:hypothetical protein